MSDPLASSPKMWVIASDKSTGYYRMSLRDNGGWVAHLFRDGGRDVEMRIIPPRLKTWTTRPTHVLEMAATEPGYPESGVCDGTFMRPLQGRMERVSGLPWASSALV